MKKPDIDWNRLKDKAVENPALFLGAAAAFVTAVTSGTSQLMRANVERKNSKTYRQEINRRVANDMMRPPRRK
jgi:hypothetical protein